MPMNHKIPQYNFYLLAVHQLCTPPTDDDDTDDSVPLFIFTCTKNKGWETELPTLDLFRDYNVYLLALVPVMLNTSPFFMM